MADDWLWIDPRCVIGQHVIIHDDDCDCVRQGTQGLDGDTP